MLIERLMMEDLNFVTTGPSGLTKGLNARSWVELRSRIQNERFLFLECCWHSRQLDGRADLMAGQIAKARAGTCVLLLMPDQASIDRGRWTLAGSCRWRALLLPHLLPSIKPQQSKTARATSASCWTLVGRSWRSVISGTPDGMGEETEAVPRRRPKAKPKSKAAAASSSGH